MNTPAPQMWYCSAAGFQSHHTGHSYPYVPGIIGYCGINSHTGYCNSQGAPECGQTGETTCGDDVYLNNYP